MWGDIRPSPVHTCVSPLSTLRPHRECAATEYLWLHACWCPCRAQAPYQVSDVGSVSLKACPFTPRRLSCGTGGPLPQRRSPDCTQAHKHGPGSGRCPPYRQEPKSSSSGNVFVPPRLPHNERDSLESAEGTASEGLPSFQA
ncbi:unnamed protein product [Pleuronectes platessa]|uniref:Uncharacterized protein n=1 Tax=Pleuronectes platessa TaxID=8262 RepID=A0A9N7TJ92_PLEPL|nr:unnamed protein product [Pleuronectes platessa]